MLRGLYQPGTLAPVSIPADTEQSTALHGGRLVAKRLRAHGVTKLFTLSGGHLFSIYDGCREEGIDIVDVRHEQSAVFAAEGWAKATREPGVCALTAGPGVTNGMSGMASALHERLAAAGPRRPGPGDALGPGLAPGDRPRAVRRAASPSSRAPRSPPRPSPGWWTRRLRVAAEAPTGPTFVDFPLDHVFMSAEVDADAPGALPDPASAPAADGGAIERAAELLRRAERPVIMAGTGLYWARAENALRALCEELRIPVFLNGLARGCVPADHPAFFSRARGTGLKGADVALVVGVPMDFRLGFGGSFGDDTEIVVVGSAPPERAHPREVAAELYGGVAATLERAARRRGGRTRPDGVERRAARGGGRAPGGGEGRAHRRARAAPSAAPLPRARAGARPQRRGDRRRRRLRVLRRAGDRHLRARLLDGSRARTGAWAPGPGLRAGGEDRPPGPPGLPAARATAPSASRAWSSTRWCATACPSSA